MLKPVRLGPAAVGWFDKLTTNGSNGRRLLLEFVVDDELGRESLEVMELAF